MRTFMLLLMAAVSFSGLQAQGIQFESLGWNQLLEKAKKEKKIIFVDAYTTWCGPCKQMASQVFPVKAVGSFFNAKFINAKIDMEAGEGINIAYKYKVNAYPTFLFVNGDGKLLHRMVGYMEPEAFIASAEDALIPERQFYTLKEWYHSGTISSAQLQYMLQKATQIGDEEVPEMAKDYFKQQSNLYTKDNINLMLSLAESSGSPENEFYQLLVKNEAKAGAVIGAKELSATLDNIAGRAALAMISENAGIAEVVTQLEKYMAKYRPANANKTALAYGIALAVQYEDWDSYEKFAVQFADKYASLLNEHDYNELAWNFYLHVANKASLTKALGWAMESVRLSSDFYNNDTVAHLYHKLGDKKNARLYAEKALKIGKEKGEDVSATEELLQTIR